MTTAPRRKFGVAAVRDRIANLPPRSKAAKTKREPTVFNDLAGQRFSCLVAREATDQRSKGGQVLWLCDCDCGGTRLAKSGELRRGHTKNCGCGMLPQRDDVQPMRPDLWDREAWDPIDDAIAKGWADVPWPYIYRVMRDNGGVLPQRGGAL